MVKTHLPAHMDSVRQKLRPKHQLLILKCYPRLPKNSAADVKPNGSELSYLLYYASTRRSKLQKVGEYLEKKTASDVYKLQSARVLVTLQIVTALLENKVVGEGSGFALIAPYVLRIIRDLLGNTNDIGLIDASLATWTVFCKHQDQAGLSADHQYRELYEQVAGQYASFAQKGGSKKLGKSLTSVNVPEGIRLRETGLRATKAVLLSDAVAFETGRQLLNVTIPAILSNLRGDDARYLKHLESVTERNEVEEKDRAVTRRQSLAVVRTSTGHRESSSEPDPRAAEGTAQDADALAEEEAAVLALDCLKAVFISENRAQIRFATATVLMYLNDTHVGTPSDAWSTKLFKMCTGWTPVQDRFILLMTAVELMVRLPLADTYLRQHQLHAHLIDSILRSDLNLIGLSTMDILLLLIQQTLRVLQRSDSVAGSSNPAIPRSNGAVSPMSKGWDDLVESLKACISDLATHVYYTDQVSDMVAAILFRLKPTQTPDGQQNPSATAAAIEDPTIAMSEVASNKSFSNAERSQSSGTGYFSFDSARKTALEVVKKILIVANTSRSSSSATSGAVSISIWEGTQWLLRDPAMEVRKAYADALVTWLELETKRSDARVYEPKQDGKKKKYNVGGEGANAVNGALARRAVSNASATKDWQSKRATSSFLQLLHLAMFENAIQYAPTSIPDMLILHKLTVTLVQRLGVNAVQSGLPMIFTLQEEIARVESPVAKIRIGSLVHGYLWSLVDTFKFGQDPIGREIIGEIARRKQHALWTQEVVYPPVGFHTILEQGEAGPVSLPQALVAHEELKPFDSREALVNCVSEAYGVTAAVSPAPSAPGSPGGRSFSLPAMDRTGSSYLTAKQVDRSLPDKFKQAMLATWSREECLASIAAIAPKSVSLTGSRSSPRYALAAGNHRQLLAAAGSGPLPPRKGSWPTSNNGNGLTGGHRQQAFGQYNRRAPSQSPDRRPSGSTNGRRDGSSSRGARGPLRVEELKRVLATGAVSAPSGSAPARPDAADDTASDSLVDVEDEELDSESGSYAAPLSQSAAGKGIKPRSDVASLLEGIGGGDDVGVKRIAMSRPPY